MIDLPIVLKTQSEFDAIELDMWHEGGFLRQILDIYPEVYRLEKFEDDSEALRSQWDVVIEFASMTMLDPDVDEATKYELIHNVEKLQKYYGTRKMTRDAAFAWWKQWRDDLNRTVARQGY